LIAERGFSEARSGAGHPLFVSVAGRTRVTVLPVTHSPPSDKSLSIEIPPATKRRLGLDDDRSWIVLTDANRFVWPGPDLRYIRPGDATSASYGLLPDGLYLEVRNKFVAAVRANRAKAVTRTE
jgi:hypothetical protein